MKSASQLASTAALSLTAALLTPFTFAQGAVQDLGPGEARGVSADGSVLVGTEGRWTEGTGWQSLSFSGGPGYFASGVSADGSVAVGVSNGRAFRWTVASGLQALGVLSPYPATAAEAVSADGDTVVGHAFDPAGTMSRAFRWTAGSGIEDLGELPGGSGLSIALAATADGTAIFGGADYSSQFSISRTFRWTAAGGMEDLGIPGNSFAMGASADGSVVVGFKDGTAYRWTAATGAQDLGTLPGFINSAAEGVSADGSVVVGNAYNPMTEVCRAFRWTAATGMEDLGAIIGAFSSCVTAVNADGSVVVGYTADATGNVRSYRWTSSEVGVRYCTPVPNSTGRAALLNVAGSDVAMDNDLELSTEFLPANQFGFFLASMTQGVTAMPGGSQGTLCLDGEIARFTGPGQIVNSGPTGSFSIVVDLTSVPAPMGNVAVMPGETWNFQAWHRDVNPTATSNFTDAVAVTFQ